jgi:FlaA1/EpsC-like NDP-sugar epimerase
LFERAESSLYFVHLELQSRHGKLQVVPVVGDILDRQKVEEVITAHAPEVIYHAAAYKHVPLMEARPPLWPSGSGTCWEAMAASSPSFSGGSREGGPLTVTDPQATRYFMLPSEAA